MRGIYAILIIFFVAILLVGVSIGDGYQVYPICTSETGLWEVRDYSIIFGRLGLYETTILKMTYTQYYENCLIERE